MGMAECHIPRSLCAGANIAAAGSWRMQCPYSHSPAKCSRRKAHQAIDMTHIIAWLDRQKNNTFKAERTNLRLDFRS